MTLRAIDGGKRDAARRIIDAKARMQRWELKHGARLAGMHPDVAIEVRAVVQARFLAGEQSGMSDDAVRECMMRVASRMRIRRYRGSPPGDEEAGRQLRECVAELGAGREAVA